MSDEEWKRLTKAERDERINKVLRENGIQRAREARESAIANQERKAWEKDNQWGEWR